MLTKPLQSFGWIVLTRQKFSSRIRFNWWIDIFSQSVSVIFEKSRYLIAFSVFCCCFHQFSSNYLNISDEKNNFINFCFRFSSATSFRFLWWLNLMLWDWLGRTRRFHNQDKERIWDYCCGVLCILFYSMSDHNRSFDTIVSRLFKQSKFWYFVVFNVLTSVTFEP